MKFLRDYCFYSIIVAFFIPVSGYSQMPNTSYKVGATKGEAVITPLGQSTYTIPLYAGPGTNGMTPSIQIQYVSQRENGVLGYGWDIAGLSTISRGNRNIYFDGNNAGITNTNTDPFFLDGQRLIPVTGTNGASGTIYATESEGFAQIASNGLQGAGPQWFLVKTKDGTQIEIGNSVDSRFLSSNGTVLFWKVNKITDANGNYMQFFYTNVGDELLLDRVEYTGNTAAGLAPYNKLKFYYANKTDMQEKYVSGTRVMSSKVLKTVESYGDAQVLRKYDFNYTTGLYTRLAEVIESDANGNRYNSSLVSWEISDNAIVRDNSFNNSGIVAKGDVNGDGQSDFVTYEQGFYRLYIYDQVAATYTSNTFPAISLAAGYNIAVSMIDFDRDGFDEIYIRVPGTSTFTYLGYRWEGNVIVSVSPNAVTQISIAEDKSILASADNIVLLGSDVDGDGTLEATFLRQRPTMYIEKIVKYNDINQTYPLPAELSNTTSNTNIQFMDFNGDGRTDISRSQNLTTTTPIDVFSYNSSTKVLDKNTTAASTLGQYDDLYWGDFNADGNSDLLVKNKTGGGIVGWHLYYSTGTTMIDKTSAYASFLTSGGALKPDITTVADFNADGKSDILFYFGGTNNTQFYCYSSNGGGFSLDMKTIGTTLYNPNTGWWFSDLNSDGRCDAYGEVGNSASHYFQKLLTGVTTSSGGNVVTDIQNGMNLNIHFDYQYTTANRGRMFYASPGLSFMSVGPDGVRNVPVLITTKKSVQNIQSLITSLDETVYSYQDARYDLSGRGFLGFEQVSADYYFGGTHLSGDYKSSTVSTFSVDNTYHVLYPTGTYVRKEDPAIPGSLVNVSTENMFYGFVDKGDKRFLLQLNSKESKDGINNITTSTSYTYDACGNPTVINETDGFSTTVTTNTFTNINGVCANKLATQSVSQTRSGNIVTTNTSYGYDAKGNLSIVTEFPGKDKSVITNYATINAFGLPTSKSIAATGLTGTVETYTYDNYGRFILTYNNALSQKTEWQYDGMGNKTYKKDVQGLITTWAYDGFGNPTQSTDPLNSVSTYTLAWASSSSVNYLYYTSVQKSGAPKHNEYFDVLGRKVSESTVNAQGNTIVVTYNYKDENNIDDAVLHKQTKPYQDGTVGTLTYPIVYTYDTYGRLVKSEDATTKVVNKTIYGEKTVTSYTDATPQLNYSSKTFNNDGSVNTVTDGQGEQLNYIYYGDGQVKQIDAAGASSSFEYDEYGRQTKLTDPNAGTTLYEYNAFGQLTRQVEADKTVFRMTYNQLGQLTEKKDSTHNKSSVYTYVGSGNGINQVQGITGADGPVQQFTYDTYGRTVSVKETVSGNAFTTAYTYNSTGQVATITYPSGFGITNGYDANGYVNSVKENTGNKVLWQSYTYNEMGQPLREILYNNCKTVRAYSNNFPASYNMLNSAGTSMLYYTYAFNQVSGNLTSRTNAKKSLTETFTYDNMDRLIGTKVGMDSIQIQYNVNGNIKRKNDVSPDDYVYDATHPHAVAGVTNPVSVPPSLKEDIVYNAAHRITSITTSSKTLSFTYGADDERRMMVLKDSTGAVLNTHYYSGDFERVVTPTATKDYHYIYSPSGLLAVVIRQNGADSIYLAYTDHQGTILALMRGDGSIAQEYNTDAWGRRRDAATWRYSATLPAPMQARCYTGHEHLDDFELVNMNACMYDPYLGRMLSPDNFVQDATSTQNFNRYSYALNNPLKYTDPSGNFIIEAMILGAMINFYLSGMSGHNSLKDAVSSLAVGAVSGAIGAGIATSGIPFANTLAIMGASLSNSSGNYLASGGKSDINISFGAASYDFSNGEWGYLGKSGNSGLANLGYALGAIGNVGDILRGVKNIGSVEVGTEKGLVGHSQAKKGNDVLIDYGPISHKTGVSPMDGTNDYMLDVHGVKFIPKDMLIGEKYLNVENLNIKTFTNYANGIDGGKYMVPFNDCVVKVSRALNISGVMNIGIHPALLYTQLYMRSLGINTYNYAYYLQNQR